MFSTREYRNDVGRERARTAEQQQQQQQGMQFGTLSIKLKKFSHPTHTYTLTTGGETEGLFLGKEGHSIYFRVKGARRKLP